MSEKNVVTAIRDALHDEIAEDERVVLLGEDVGARGGVFRISDGWMRSSESTGSSTRRSPSRASSASRSGWRCTACCPIAEIQFADFIHPAFDQIVSEAARIRYRSNGDFGVPW
jgi:2-oxoisovalerate dehydrogenase E1 component beta subunit